MLAEGRNPPRDAMPEHWKGKKMKLCQSSLTCLLTAVSALGSGASGRTDTSCTAAR